MGLLLGAVDGDKVGCELGDPVGTAEGVSEGPSVGAEDGAWVSQGPHSPSPLSRTGWMNSTGTHSV